MYLARVEVFGFRAASEKPLTCILPGRFAVLLGANGAGKSTVCDAITLAHGEVFPAPVRCSTATLSSSIDRHEVAVAYEFEADEPIPAWELRKSYGGKPAWSRRLKGSLGRVRREPPVGDLADNIVVFHLSATRNSPVDLAGRDAHLIVQLLKAQQRQNDGKADLGSVRQDMSVALSCVNKDPIVAGAEERVAQMLRKVTEGVSGRGSFLATTRIDDAFLARVFEFFSSALSDTRLSARRLEVESLGRKPSAPSRDPCCNSGPNQHPSATGNSRRSVG